MIGYPETHASCRFREIAALLEAARDAITAFEEEGDQSELSDAVARIDAAILKCESAGE